MRRLLLLIAIVAALIVPAVPVAALNVFQGVCTQGSVAGDSAVCQSSDGDPLTTKDGVLHRVTNIVAVVAGVAAVIVIIVAGIRYITSGGDAEQTKKAKRAIIYAAVGLLVIVFGQLIISLLVGGFN